MDKQGVTIGGELLSLEHLKKKSENAVELCEKIGVGAPAWPYRAILALLDHIEAQQGERQAFVAGADWHASLQYGPYNAEVEAAKRYPAARPTPETYSTILDSLCSDCKMRLQGILPEADDKQKRP